MQSARHASLVLLALAAAACAGTRGGANVPEPASVAVPTPEAAPAAAATEPEAPAAPSAPASPRNYVTYTIKVNGMTCPIRCVREVRDFLKAVPGVLHVEIDYDSRSAIVDVAPGTPPETVVAGLKSPYTGRLVAN